MEIVPNLHFNGDCEKALELYGAWGHSMVVDPFGEILVNLGRAEGLGLAEVDPDRLKDVRSRLPLLAQRRDDLYDLRLIQGVKSKS